LPPDSNQPPSDDTQEWVQLGGYFSEVEANRWVAKLNHRNIPTQITPQTRVGIRWSDHQVYHFAIFVHAADKDHGERILGITHDDLEPDPKFANSPPPVDKHGNPLLVIGAYETFKEFRDAETVLASAKIPSFTPPFIRRGNHPPGYGKRFVLRVAQEHFKQAQSVLNQESDEDRDEPRCPKCGSWQVQIVDSLIVALENMIGYGPGEQLAQCDSCQYRAELSKFLRTRR
jgi:hypothetical protein